MIGLYQLYVLCSCAWQLLWLLELVAIFCGCGDFAYVVITHTDTVPLLQL